MRGEGERALRFSQQTAKMARSSTWPWRGLPWALLLALVLLSVRDDLSARPISGAQALLLGGDCPLDQEWFSLVPQVNGK